MTTPHALLAPHLAPGETLLWQEAITDERFAQADIREPLKNGLLALGAAILGLWFAYWGILQLIDLLQKPDYLTLSFGAPVVIVLVIVLFWFVYMSIRRITGPAPEEVLPALYAVTSARLIALKKDGNIADELPVPLIDGFADLESDTELLVKKQGDETGDDAFYMVMIEDADAARTAITAVAS